MFALHLIMWILGVFTLIFRMATGGIDPYFVLDVMLVAMGGICMMHSTIVANECRKMRALFEKNTADSYENERLKKVICDFERLTNELD